MLCGRVLLWQSLSSDSDSDHRSKTPTSDSDSVSFSFRLQSLLSWQPFALFLAFTSMITEPFTFLNCFKVCSLPLSSVLFWFRPHHTPSPTSSPLPCSISTYQHISEQIFECSFDLQRLGPVMITLGWATLVTLKSVD